MFDAVTLTGPAPATPGGVRRAACDVLVALTSLRPEVYAVRLPVPSGSEVRGEHLEAVRRGAPAEDHDSSELAQALAPIAARHDWQLHSEQASSDPRPSPLANAGFDGPGFDGLSRDLFRGATSTLVDLAARLPDDPSGAYRLVLPWLAAHAAETVRHSEQRARTGLPFAELLALRMLSFRSHFEGFAARVADRDALERRFAQEYERLGEGIRTAVAAEAASPDGPSRPDGPTQAWVQLVAEQSGPLREACRAGDIVDAGLTLDDLNRGRATPLAPTQFHGTASPHLHRLLHDDADFLSFRVLTSLLYSGIYTLGFSLPERYLFCYLMARANEDVAGRPVRELQLALGEVARTMAVPG